MKQESDNTLGCNNDWKVPLILFRACIRKQRLCTLLGILSLHWCSTTEATNCDQSCRSSDWVYRKLRKPSTTLWEVSALGRIDQIYYLQRYETNLWLYYTKKKQKKQLSAFWKCTFPFPMMLLHINKTSIIAANTTILFTLINYHQILSKLFTSVYEMALAFYLIISYICLSPFDSFQQFLCLHITLDTNKQNKTTQSV